jgi:2-dehydro-3-deoxyphosphogluconate aldolase/(4S)-4-hydroxy-2-oxoglutarate aldolase
MHKQDIALAAIIDQAVLPLFYDDDVQKCIRVLDVLYASGVRAVEFTNRGIYALANFKQMLQHRDTALPGMLLGIGTLKDGKDAQAFITAGADFTISPGMVPEVAAVAAGAGLLWIPGCMTVTEVIEAEALKVKLVKLFPGNLLGPAFVQSIKDIFPDMLFMPTGGVDVTADNINGWFKAGVCAVGMGSKLISKDLLEQGGYEAIGRLTVDAIQLSKAAASRYFKRRTDPVI